MRKFAALALLLCAGLAHGTDPDTAPKQQVISANPEVDLSDVGLSDEVTLQLAPPATSTGRLQFVTARWTVDCGNPKNGDKHGKRHGKTNPDGTATFRTGPYPDKYTVTTLAVYVFGDKQADGSLKNVVVVPSVLTTTVATTGFDPVPPTPVPPGPTPPGPTPPIPPQPPAPIPGDGFRVLFVYESAELGKLTREQTLSLVSQDVRAYLDAKCAVGPDGKTKESRWLDKDDDMSGESKLWQDAMKLPRTQLPWLVISNGTTGYSGPLPATMAETMALLKKYAEGK